MNQYKKNANKPPTQFQIATSLLTDIKSSLSITDIGQYDTFSSISDELFNLLNHVVLFSNQLSLLLKKNQTIKTLLTRTKISLSNEIVNFFDTITIHNIQPNPILRKVKQISFDIISNTSYKHSKINNQSPSPSKSLHLLEELSNENIIEKIKDKIKQNSEKKSRTNNISTCNHRNKKETQCRNNYINKKKETFLKPSEYYHKIKSLSIDTPSYNLKQIPRSSSSDSEKSGNDFLQYMLNDNQCFGDSASQRNFLSNSLKLRKQCYHSLQTGKGVNLTMSNSYSQVCSKPSTYTNYLVNKNKGVIEDYNKKTGKKTHVHSNSFSDRYWPSTFDRKIIEE